MFEKDYLQRSKVRASKENSTVILILNIYFSSRKCCLLDMSYYINFTTEANTINLDQTAPKGKGAVCSWSILFEIKATKVHKHERESRQQLY